MHCTSDRKYRILSGAPEQVHWPVLFDIDFPVKNDNPKRCVLNYKMANWEEISIQLENIMVENMGSMITEARTKALPSKVTFEQRFYRTEFCHSNFFNRATKCANFIQRQTTLDVMNDASIFRHNLKKFSLRILLKIKIVNLIFFLMLVIYLVHNV